MTDLQQIATWLIVKLCINTNVDRAIYSQDMTKDGEHIGTYRITIEKLCPTEKSN